MFSPFGLLRPTISMQLIDSNTGQPLDSKSNIAPSITHTDIKKDGSGKMVMVRHKSQPGSLVNGGGDADAAPKGNKNNNGKKNGKQNDNNQTKATEANGEGGKPWTAEDDAKLKELKAEGTTWNNIATEMGRSKQEVQDRFKEIKDQPAGEEKKGDAAPAAGASGGGDFTADEDARIKELIGASTSNKDIAEALSRPLDKALKAHIANLRKEVAGGAAAPAGGKKQDDAAKAANVFTAADDAKIKELLDAGKPFNDIAKELGKTMGKDFADHVKKVKEQAGGGDATADKKEDDGGGKKNKKKNKGGGDGNAEKKAEKEKAAKEEEEEKEKEKSKDHKHSAKPSSKAGSVVSRRSHRSEAKFTMREWITLQEDELFSFGELQLLTELINKDPGRSWLSVASAFMDKTGRRVHPEDIKDKFDEMARMG